MDGWEKWENRHFEIRFSGSHKRSPSRQLMIISLFRIRSRLLHSPPSQNNLYSDFCALDVSIGYQNSLSPTSITPSFSTAFQCDWWSPRCYPPKPRILQKK